MPKSYIHKFHVSGMYNSEDVAVVRSTLVTMPGVSAVNVDLRKMQAQLTAIGIIGAATLRNAFRGTDFELSELTTTAITTSPGVRDDEIDEPTISI
jgi:hypothetical protein